ncbi:copper resistance protein CopC [Nonomuraea sp. NPDC050556]|uniref:copper resistance protein CopC n=1 Tax=Nonomuraea sp. NPDC050556 TaxID=3364369 RepID=UPI003797DAD0
MHHVRRFLLAAVCGGILLMSASPALAHDSLKSSSPAKDARVDAVKEITLEYSARVRFPFVVLHDTAGRKIALGEPRADGPKVITEVGEKLPPGAYVIAWRVVSSDGHPIEGEIPFTVMGAASPGSSAPAASATSASSSESRGIPVWVWVTGGVLLLAGVGLALRSRRSGT